MNIIAKTTNPLFESSDALILGFYENQKLKDNLATINKEINNELNIIIKNKEFSGKFKDILTLNTHSKFPFRNLIMVGLGKQKELTTNKLRKATATAFKIANSNKFNKITTTLNLIKPKQTNPQKTAQIIIEGILLGLYEFKKYLTSKENQSKINKITLITSKENQSKIKNGIKKGIILSNNINKIRDLVNEPAEKVTPTYLANQAKLLAKNSKGKIKAKVFNLKQIKKLKMGGLLAVGKGSSQEPKFIILEYKNSTDKPTILIGKGVTFDSGGLDVKPANYMEDMKCDMAGAATVLCTIKAVYELNLKTNLVAIIPACENMSSGKAYKQGDILTSYNKKTIEVWHTDAEGRLILADALGYADKNYKAKAIIDIATLTGASIYALGYEITSLISTNEKLKNQILKSAKETDEYTWELPIIEEYLDLVNGNIADVRNVSKEKLGPGTITAGIFLSNFIDKAPWAHLDIGASGWSPKDSEYIKKGGTGKCLKTFINLLENN